MAQRTRPFLPAVTVQTAVAAAHTRARCNQIARRWHPAQNASTSLAEKTLRLAILRRKQNADKKIGIVLFGFPPNAGAVGTAAYLSVFESLFNTLNKMKSDGYRVDVPETVDDLRAAILLGNSAQYGQQANVAAHVDADTIVRTTPPLAEIEAVWGPAPGKIQSDGRGVFVLGHHFGNVFVGVQPAFGYEGDPMRLLFEKGFAPTHAFVTFYLVAAQHVQRRCASAFWHARRAGIHAWQTSRPWCARLA